jgi:competence protein ComEC
MALPLLWVSLAFIAGILLAKLVSLPLYVWLIFLALAISAAIILHSLRARLSTLHFPLSNLKPSTFKLPTLTLASACVIALFIGAARFQAAVPEPSISQIAWFNDREYDILVTGTLVEPPDYRDTYTNLRLRVEKVDTGDHQFDVNGLLLARVNANQTYHYGEIVRLRGRLQTPPENEDFSYRDYLAREGILSYMPSADATLLPGSGGNPIVAFIYGIKEKSLDKVYRLFLDPEASLLAGILLGVDSGLSGPLEQAFKNTGTAHIIAISGFNIAIIAAIFIKLFSRILGPRVGAVVAVLGIGFYTFLVGANAAVVRAALMGTLSLFAVQVGRRQQGLNTLAFVAALMAVFNPLILWDVGFQLSFFATLGLVLYGDPFQQAAGRFFARYLPLANVEKISGLFAEFALLTFAAQLTTLPIMAYEFKQISLVSFVANPFILPAQPAVMILGGLAVFASFLFFPLGQVIAWAAWPFTAYTIRMVEFFNAVPHGVIYLGAFSLGFVILFYAVLLTFTFGGSPIKDFLSSVNQRFQYLSASTILAALLILAMFIWRLVAVMPDGRLHITFLNAGSADAVLIQTPTGRNILIDGGPSASSLSDTLGRRLSPLDHSLDWLILASTKENQVASLPRLLPRYPPKNVLLGGNQQASFSSQEVMQWLADESIPVTPAEEGQTLDLGKGATLKLVNVSSAGATLLIEWNGFRSLLPIGENFDTLDQLEYGNTVGSISVLSLAQSGFAPLTPPDLIQNLDPQLTVLSVAAGDQDGLPDTATLDALAGRSLLRTDLNGWIEVKTDGKQMWVRVEKK